MTCFGQADDVGDFGIGKILDKIMIVNTSVHAAENQCVNVLQCFNGTQHGMRYCGNAVIVEGDIFPCSHFFHAMRNACKVFDAADNRFIR
ncbi:hypothetical protein SDC9_202708 [bioreactor metagenome]|uniref:Uncharacterized protein n=1 Tax=bioreactor metagenome TaxID=1076179 RepID=A0A645IX64_9ZZZZ